MVTLNSQYALNSKTSFGEGPTQKIIETVFPSVKEKREKLQSGIASEGKDATSLVTSILAHHIDPDAETKKEEPKNIIIEKPVEKPAEQPILATKNIAAVPNNNTIITAAENKTVTTPIVTQNQPLPQVAVPVNKTPTNQVTTGAPIIPVIANNGQPVTPMKMAAFCGDAGKVLNILA